MKLTLEPEHPLAKAIINATTDIGSSGHLVLSLDRLDRDGNHSRPLSLKIMSWVLGRSGKHARDDDPLVFTCELDDTAEYQRFLAITAGGAL